MKVKSVFETPMGAKVAILDDDRIIASNHSMYLYPCKKVEAGYKVIGEGIVAGWMMKSLQDFKEAVESLKEEYYQKALAH